MMMQLPNIPKSFVLQNAIALAKNSFVSVVISRGTSLNTWQKASCVTSSH